LSGETLPPAFFIVGLNLVGRTCVVIGDDGEAERKADALTEVGATLRRVRDAATLRDADLAEAFLVISTPQDAALSARLRELAEGQRFLLCCIDQPQYGFVAMQAVVAAGPARIGISTGGVAPRVGKLLKEALQGALDSRFARFVACHGVVRRRVRADAANAAQRRAAMLALSRGFAVDVKVRYPAWFEDAERAQAPAVQSES
jgi:siroheme synthase (precorrin-2 oxidase/ferrochelatase)